MSETKICPKCGHNADAGQFVSAEEAIRRGTCEVCGGDSETAVHNLRRDEVLTICGDCYEKMMVGWLERIGYKCTRVHTRARAQVRRRAP